MTDWIESATAVAELGWLPDALIRRGVRRLIAERWRTEAARLETSDGAYLGEHLRSMRASPMARATVDANQQHYEVPAAFFEAALGPRLKYSGCFFSDESSSLAEAEGVMLQLTCERAELTEGQRILELGCGWGSLSLWMAERYPGSTVLAVSNSATQRGYIEARARERSLPNLSVLTEDMNRFQPPGVFDRIVSVEMFEHMSNWEVLLRRLRGHVEARSGRLFVHVFSHRELCYFFEDEGSGGDWMARHFFTGGMMPAHGLLSRLEIPWEIEADWVVDGTHYERTARAWLENLDRRRREARAALEASPSGSSSRRALGRWRLFMMACEELFGFRGGSEWQVSHYRLRPSEAT